MINFHGFFDNQFTVDDGVSLEELCTYTTTHLTRLPTAPGNPFASRVTATQTAFNGLETSLSDGPLKLGLQKARTQMKNDFREALPAKIGMISAVVVAKFGEDSPQWNQCLPEGRAVFGRCKDSELNNKLTALVGALTSLQAQLGAQVVTDATALKTSWDTLYADAQSGKTGTSGNRLSTQDARALVEKELMTNILTVAIQFPGDFAKCDFYCPQQLLQNPVATTPPPKPTLEGSFDVDITKVILIFAALGATGFKVQRRTTGAGDDAWEDNVAMADSPLQLGDMASGSYDYRVIAVNVAGESEPSDFVTVVVP